MEKIFNAPETRPGISSVVIQLVGFFFKVSNQLYYYTWYTRPYARHIEKSLVSMKKFILFWPKVEGVAYIQLKFAIVWKNNKDLGYCLNISGLVKYSGMKTCFLAYLIN